MAQLLKAGAGVYTASGTCVPDALDEQLHDLLSNFDKTYPEASLTSVEHQVVVITGVGALPLLLVSLLVNFCLPAPAEESIMAGVRRLYDKGQELTAEVSVSPDGEGKQRASQVWAALKAAGARVPSILQERAGHSYTFPVRYFSADPHLAEIRAVLNEAHGKAGVQVKWPTAEATSPPQNDPHNPLH